MDHFLNEGLASAASSWFQTHKTFFYSSLTREPLLKGKAQCG